jgi:hypothetical protein
MHKIKANLIFVILACLFSSYLSFVFAENLNESSEKNRFYFHSDTGVLFPGTLGGFQLAQIKDYETKDPGGGICLEYYYSANAKVSIFLYTQGLSNIPSGIQSSTIKDEFQLVSAAVFELEKRGMYQNLEILVPEEEITIGGHPFLHEKFTYFSEGFLNMSHTYLTGYKNHFLKIRISNRGNIEEDEKIVLGFLEAFGKQLKIESRE